MLNRLTKVIILICGLVIFEVVILSIICFYAKVSFSASKVESGEPVAATASNLNVIFSPNEFPIPAKTKTIIFVGDMMFDRGVEALSAKNGADYPLLKIKPFLLGADYVSANLEGPIVKKPQYFGAHALTFNSGPELIPVLQAANINLVTLANNHILNRGQEGFKQTKEFLTANQINYSGDPFKCGTDLALIKDNIIFLGINKTFPTDCQDKEISQTIQTLKQESPDNFIIVSIHWGVEYQTKNSASQKKLAHLLVDNGADLILGSHPHVVQNIEEYNGKLIFYSLGNFVFDQYFSQKTQQSLAVKLELGSDKEIYGIFPLQSRLSQPQLMVNKERIEFLKQLAANSSTELQAAIKDGQIEIKF